MQVTCHSVNKVTVSYIRHGLTWGTFIRMLCILIIFIPFLLLVLLVVGFSPWFFYFLESRYSRQLEETETPCVGLRSTHEDVFKILKKVNDYLAKNTPDNTLTFQDASSSKLLQASEQSSSSATVSLRSSVWLFIIIVIKWSAFVVYNSVIAE